MPALDYLFSLARRYRVKLAKMDEGKYRIAGDGARVILMVIDDQGEAWYGTYGVPPFPHPITRQLIPATCYARKQYGVKAENLDDPFIAASTQDDSHQRVFPALSTSYRRIIKEEKYREQSGRCYYCPKFLKYDQATLDHKVPLAEGGADAAYNIVVSCLPCNRDKGCATVEQFQSTAD